jgi:DNA-binding NarL/FixJ family response regulator
MVRVRVRKVETVGERVHATRRQAEILGLAARDVPDKQIAEQLHVSLCTVRTHWQRFYRTNGVHSRAGAVALYLRIRNVLP